MKKALRLLLFGIPVIAALLGASLAEQSRSNKAGPLGSGLAITPSPPAELNPSGGGPAKATLQQAAEFAWNEFFALNWPAGPQNGQPGQRDTASGNCAFGDQSPSCAGPLVWQTFRGKVEIFPGTGQQPNGFPSPTPTPPVPPGYSWGYDALPQYNYYVSTVAPIVKPIQPCQGQSPVNQAAWINLDETDEITLNSMYAGVVKATPPGNSAPQLVRFMAKANRAEYVYMASQQWWGGNAPTGATAQYVKANMSDPPDNVPNTSMYVILPPNAVNSQNTIETKAGWRVLNPSEASSGRFHTATVRYYENDGTGTACYREGTFGLVALHIIQKTPLAPYFIYASFEQADNILDVQGRALEDADGKLVRIPPCLRPVPCNTTPSTRLNDTSTINPNNVPPQVVLQPPSSQYCTAGTNKPPPNRLYYLNTKGKTGLPTGGYICVNRRDNNIPPVIVSANQSAHALIKSYSAQHGIANSVWQYYKLVNVQYVPIDKNHAGPFGRGPGENNPATGSNPNSYYLANIVVETNHSLQLFSGGLVGAGSTGSNSDYQSQFDQQPSTAIHHNTFFAGTGYNMGGCMGCHGSQGQSQGGAFSVIVAEQFNDAPEYPAVPGATGAAAVPRNRTLR
jgi:hypothetical protein